MKILQSGIGGHRPHHELLVGIAHVTPGHCEIVLPQVLRELKDIQPEGIGLLFVDFDDHLFFQETIEIHLGHTIYAGNGQDDFFLHQVVVVSHRWIDGDSKHRYRDPRWIVLPDEVALDVIRKAQSGSLHAIAHFPVSDRDIGLGFKTQEGVGTILARPRVDAIQMLDRGELLFHGLGNFLQRFLRRGIAPGYVDTEKLGLIATWEQLHGQTHGGDHPHDDDGQDQHKHRDPPIQ